jgi:hypothetical protein
MNSGFRMQKWIEPLSRWPLCRFHAEGRAHSFPFRYSLILLLPLLFFANTGKALASGTNAAAEQPDSGISWGVYATAQTVQRLAGDEAARIEALEKLALLRVKKVYLEVYRSGLVVPAQDLEIVRDFFLDHDMAVAGGIATVPGPGFGVAANEGLQWFNWQNPGTRRDLIEVMRDTAPLFDEFIVDDFLCTGDTSEESLQAKGARSWSQYRRDLLTEISRDVFVKTAREVNPAITMVIKYPQWYDRFHLFGYDVVRQSALYDRVWVGTETRGSYTQRFGFVQPYEGFVNYRWLKSVAGKKVRGAWFDHGDCDANDFVDQAWQTVLAGAREIVFFNMSNLIQGHPGHDLLRHDFDVLDRLAEVVASNPVQGAVAYKPPNSDAGGDLYIMDFLGMLGIPLVPHASYPDWSEVIFLPTQAATDDGIAGKLEHSLQSGKTVVVTSGFLQAMSDKYTRLNDLAGVQLLRSGPVQAESIRSNGQSIAVTPALKLGAELAAGAADALLEAESLNGPMPFLTECKAGSGRLLVLNVHTYSQAEFDAVGEVLLSPAQLGLLALPEEWLNLIRRGFSDGRSIRLEAPARVTFQPIGRDGWMLQNYNNHPVNVRLEFQDGTNTGAFLDGISGESIADEDGGIEREIGARARLWIR